MKLNRVILYGLVLAVLVPLVWPALGDVGTHFVGIEYVDHYGTQWFYWFLDYQFENDLGFAHTDLFFYPWGKDIFGHTGSNVLDALLALPFRRILGPVAGYNVFVLLGLAASAAAFYRLAKDHSDDEVAVVVGTLLFATTPYVLLELVEGRPTQAILFFPVLFLMYLFRLASRRGWKAPVLAGCCLALAGYQYWYYAFFGGILALGYGLLRIAWPAEGSGGRWRTLARFSLAGAVAILICAPVAVPMLTNIAEGGVVPGLLNTNNWSLRATPPITMENQSVGLFLWQPLRRMAGFFILGPDGQERFLSSAILVSWVALPVFALACYRPGRMDRRGVVVMVVLASLIAMGPLFLLGEHALPNPVYIQLSKWLSFLRRLWWPSRAVSYLVILLGICAVVSLDWFGGRGRRFQLMVAALMSFFWVKDLRSSEIWPLPRWDATIPAGYRCLAEGEPGAIIELPFNWTQGHLYFQSAHGRPIFGGMLENNPVFTPTEHQEFQKSNGFISAILEESAAVMSRRDQTPEGWNEQDKQELYDLGYRYVVLQKDALDLARDDNRDAEERRRFRLTHKAMRTRQRRVDKRLRNLLGPPVFSDARIQIFSPWGAPAPCDLEGFELDRETHGLTEVDTLSLLEQTPGLQIIQRVLVAVEDDEDDEEETEATDQGAFPWNPLQESEEEEESEEGAAPVESEERLREAGEVPEDITPENP